MKTAPLFEVEGLSRPPGGEAFWIQARDGARLRAARFLPAMAPKGAVILSPGRTEVIEKYYEVIAELLGRGLAVVVHDWRGQGLSHRSLRDPLKGHARGRDAFLADYEVLLARLGEGLPGPWLAIGHSMGGCLTLLALASGQAERFDGAILSAPMLGVLTGSVPPPRARLLAKIHCLLGLAGGYVPNQPRDPLVAAFAGNVLTHDEARFERAARLLSAHPELALGAPTWGWLDFAFQATDALARPHALDAVSCPLIVVSAEEDALVDNVAQRQVTLSAPDGRFVVAPGARHEILMEVDATRALFWGEFDTLLAQVLARRGAA